MNVKLPELWLKYASDDLKSAEVLLKDVKSKKTLIFGAIINKYYPRPKVFNEKKCGNHRGRISRHLAV